MKQATTLVAMTLGLALALPISANEHSSNPAATEAGQQDAVSLAQIAAPSDFSDDICWVAPEWREL
jgi:hypothetical protein